MQLQRKIKQGQVKIRKRNQKNTAKIKVVKLMEKIIIHISNKMPDV